MKWYLHKNVNKKKIKLNNFVNNYSQKVNNQFIEKFCNNQRNNTII